MRKLVSKFDTEMLQKKPLQQEQEYQHKLEILESINTMDLVKMKLKFIERTIALVAGIKETRKQNTVMINLKILHIIL